MRAEHGRGDKTCAPENSSRNGRHRPRPLTRRVSEGAFGDFRSLPFPNCGPPEGAGGCRRTSAAQGSCSASGLAALWTESCSIRFSSGTTCFRPKATIRRQQSRASRRTPSGTVSFMRRPGLLSRLASISGGVEPPIGAGRSAGRAFVGWLLVGWGLFNLVEGVVDHHILAIHHVREGPEINETAWDLS